jgi:hypothetical protein
MSGGGSSPSATCILIEIALIVFRFGVTFSPRKPSPRVAPRTNAPFSYRRLIERPSIFGSVT